MRSTSSPSISDNNIKHDLQTIDETVDIVLEMQVVFKIENVHLIKETFKVIFVRRSNGMTH